MNSTEEMIVEEMIAIVELPKHKKHIYNKSVFDVQDGYLIIYKKIPLYMAAQYAPGTWLNVCYDSIRGAANE